MSDWRPDRHRDGSSDSLGPPLQDLGEESSRLDALRAEVATSREGGARQPPRFVLSLDVEGVAPSGAPLRDLVRRDVEGPAPASMPALGAMWLAAGWPLFTLCRGRASDACLCAQEAALVVCVVLFCLSTV